MKCRTLLLLTVLSLVISCTVQRRISEMGERGLSAGISLPGKQASLPEVNNVAEEHRDTLKVTGLDGREVLIMKAIRDESTGEMVATEQLDAAVVTARFRNVAERHGKVDLEFLVTVPSEMHDSKWQIRLHPDMWVLKDSIRLDDVVITGADYRKAQLRGYQQYEKFLSRIINDTLAFVRLHELEVFIERNLPEVYAFKNDSSYVSDDDFTSAFGVTEQEAVRHYTNMLAFRWNERRKGRTDKMWRRYVKTPIVTDGIRLDTVMRNLDGDFVYNYVQTVYMRPGLRKVDIKLGGEIFEEDRRLYTIPVSEPLTFYISSVSAFVDDTERYLTKVITRNVEANTTSYIDFRAGRSEIDEKLSDNIREIGVIKENLRNLMVNPEFGLDSIVIVAWASPEGSGRSNALLTKHRAESASAYFSKYLRVLEDSVRMEKGFFIDFDGKTESGAREYETGRIGFISRSGGENWPGLDDKVITDTLMTDAEREAYFRIVKECDDIDEREKRLASMPSYRHLKEDFYPKLRTVVFNFHLHRIGMIKDTVFTTVLDTAYMRGIQCIKDHDYETAIALLGPYQDYNAAVAYVALDRNLSAYSILKDCNRTPRVNYMLALIHSRLGEERSAVQCYLQACEAGPSYVYRGNLDPEISALIKKYGLNKDNE